MSHAPNVRYAVSVASAINISIAITFRPMVAIEQVMLATPAVHGNRIRPGNAAATKRSPASRSGALRTRLGTRDGVYVFGQRTRVVLPQRTGPPFILSDYHMRRLLDGLLLMTGSRADWAILLRRSHDIDVLDCPRCHGRLRLLAVVRDKHQARRFLRYLGEPDDPQPLASARDPTFDFCA
jgi:hypothetical protein